MFCELNLLTTVMLGDPALSLQRAPLNGCVTKMIHCFRESRPEMKATTIKE